MFPALWFIVGIMFGFALGWVSLMIYARDVLKPR
jgi:hypothetical protein